MEIVEQLQIKDLDDSKTLLKHTIKITAFVSQLKHGTTKHLSDIDDLRTAIIRTLEYKF